MTRSMADKWRRAAGTIGASGWWAVLALAAACAKDDAPLRLTRTATQTTASAVLASARAVATERTVSVAEFQAHNPQRLIGRTHSTGLRDFFKQYTTTGKRKACESLEGAWSHTKGTLGRDTSLLGIADSVAQALNSIVHRACPSRSPARTVSFTPLAPTKAGSAPPSGDPQPYIEAVSDAVTTSANGSEFTSVVSAIVTDAEGTLSGDELTLVYASSSVAVDSYDYWITQNGFASTAASMQQTYGGCVEQHPSDPYSCFTRLRILETDCSAGECSG